jgi:hypothetical protein
LRRGFRWAPDSKSIAFWQIDQSGVRVVNLINNTDHLYPQLVPIPYPKAGEQNPACRIGVVSVDVGGSGENGGGGGAGEEDDRKSASTSALAGVALSPSSPPKITWIHLPGDPRNHYIASLDWIPGSKELVFQRLNRLQNTVHVIVAEPATGNIRVAFTGESFVGLVGFCIIMHVQFYLDWYDFGCVLLCCHSKLLLIAFCFTHEPHKIATRHGLTCKVPRGTERNPPAFASCKRGSDFFGSAKEMDGDNCSSSIVNPERARR